MTQSRLSSQKCPGWEEVQIEAFKLKSAPTQEAYDVMHSSEGESITTYSSPHLCMLNITCGDSHTQDPSLRGLTSAVKIFGNRDGRAIRSRAEGFLDHDLVYLRAIGLEYEVAHMRRKEDSAEW